MKLKFYRRRRPAWFKARRLEAYFFQFLDILKHMIYAKYMRTTLDLPDEVIDQAREVLGFKSKTDTVVYALKEVIRRGHVQGLTGLFGKVHIELDLGKSRGRAAASAGAAKP
jgi:hypothetical protein